MTASLQEAAQSFERACTLGFAAGCSNATEVQRGGRDVSDVPRTVDVLRLMQQQRGPLRPPAIPDGNPSRLSSLEAACASRNATACTELGLAYLEGRARGGTDYVKAAALLEQACAGGQAVGCANLGLMHRRGAGVPVNESKARELLGRACIQGVADACRMRDGAP